MQTNHSKSIKELSIAVIVISAIGAIACVVSLIALGVGAWAWDEYGTSAIVYSNNQYDSAMSDHLGNGHHYGIYYDDADLFGLMNFALVLGGVLVAWELISSVITLVAGILGLRRGDDHPRMGSVFGWGVAGAIAAGLAGRFITCVLLVIVAVFANKDKNMTEEEYRRTGGAPNAPAGAGAGYAPWGQPAQPQPTANAWGQPAQPQPTANAWGQPAQPYAGYPGAAPASGYAPPTQQPFAQATSAYQAGYCQPASPTSFAQDQVDAAWGQPMRPAGVQPTWMQPPACEQQPFVAQSPSAYQITYGQSTPPAAAQPTPAAQPVAEQPPAAQSTQAVSEQPAATPTAATPANAQSAAAPTAEAVSSAQEPAENHATSEAAEEEKPRQS